MEREKSNDGVTVDGNKAAAFLYGFGRQLAFS
jgi:hypothetical protein